MGGLLVAVRITRRRVELDGHEGIAEELAEVLEPLGRAELVTGESEPEHARTGRSPFLHAGRVGR